MKKDGPDSIDFFEKSEIPMPRKEVKKEIVELEKGLGKKFGSGGKKSEYIINQFKKFWSFLKKDSWQSLVVTLIIAFVVIKFLFFPFLSFATGAALPLVIVESCSMYHSDGLEEVMQNQIYSDYNLTLDDANGWGFNGGLSKGDIIFVVSAKDIEVGDIIVFQANQRHPVIHRIIEINENTVTTKGDHNSGLLPTEKDIDRSQIMGKAVFKIPFVGWVKLIFFEGARVAEDRGLCK